MSAGAILSSLDGAVARLVIDRTERGNLLTLDMVTALAAAMRAVPADAKAVHLYGVGADFCRGRDPAGSPEAVTALDVRARLIEPILSLYEAIAACPIPVVASVNGAARGLGAALAGACDVTIASATARFALPEMEKDLPPTLAISALMRRVPAKPLAYLVLSLEEIDAQTAREIGLVSHVVEGDAVAGAHPFLATLAARSRTALVAVKDYLRAAPEIGPQPRHDLAANLLACVLSSRAS